LGFSLDDTMTTPAQTEKDAFQQVIQALTEQAEYHEQRAAHLRRLLAGIQAEATTAPVTFQPPDVKTGHVASQPVLVLSQQRPPRIPTSKLVLDAVQAQPGIRFDELAERTIPLIQSDAKNKRKLVHSTVDYLSAQAKKIRFDAGGGMHLNTNAPKP